MTSVNRLELPYERFNNNYRREIAVCNQRAAAGNVIAARRPTLDPNLQAQIQSLLSLRAAPQSQQMLAI